MRWARITIGLALLAASALSQTEGVAAWNAIRAKSPFSKEVSLRLTEPHVYVAGELIRAEVNAPIIASGPAARPAELWQFAGFLLDPPADCGSLSAPCFSSMYLFMDRSEPTLNMGRSKDPLTVVLNRYFRDLKPGRYRAAWRLAKQVLKSEAAKSVVYGYPNPPEYAISNVVEFEIAPATPEWAHQTIAKSVADLSNPQPGNVQDVQRRLDAVEQLRSLDTPESWRASLSVLSADEYGLLMGLAGTREPAKVCALMQAAVADSSQMVSSRYITTLTGVCTRTNLPPAPPYQPQPPGQKPPEPTVEQKEWMRKRMEYVENLTDSTMDVLAANLGAKQGPAKTAALEAFIERVQSVMNNQPRKPMPSWLPKVKAEFLRFYPQMDHMLQRQLLGQYASTLGSPDLIPLLESVMDEWKPGDYYEAPREALRYLNQIDPARAQARILAELAKSRTWIDQHDLELLPASAAHLSDNALIDALAAAQRMGGWNPNLRMAAIAKYASPKALPRIRAIYESQQDPCQPELIAYFVRVDPAYADRLFRAKPWDMHSKENDCALQEFNRIPPLAMSPGLENYLTAHLMHEYVPLKLAAVKSLEKYGSSAAVGPLWDALRYFHEYWKGKKTELQQNPSGMMLEIALRDAIARGMHWFADEKDLHAIESLCISDQCLQQTRENLREWQQPIRIDLNRFQGAFSARLVQYFGIETVSALAERLTHFPKGTRFKLAAYGTGADANAVRIRKFAAEHGLVIVEP